MAQNNANWANRHMQSQAQSDAWRAEHNRQAMQNAQQRAQQKAQESLAARQFEINILKGTPSEHRLYKGEKK
jgi:hypothetical protein